MSRPPMDNGNTGREDLLLQRYQEANALDSARPSAALRDAVMTHANLHAPAPGTSVEPQKQAANDTPWKLRAMGSLAVVGLMGLLVMQFERGTPEEQKVALGTPAPQTDSNTEATQTRTTAPLTETLGNEAAPTEAESPPSEAPTRPASPPLPPPPVNAGAIPPTRPAPAAKPAVPKAPDAAERAMASAPKAIESLAKAAPAPAMKAAPEMAQADAPEPLDRAKSAVPARSALGESSANVRREIAAESQTNPSGKFADPLAPRLHAAAAKGDLAAMQSLLAQGADINTLDNQGRTALMLAILGQHQKLVVALMDAGADASLRDQAGFTAADLAVNAGHADWLPLLQPRR